MPLVIVTIVFIVLFSCEGFCFMERRGREKRALERYEHFEHTHRERSDRYIDLYN